MEKIVNALKPFDIEFQPFIEEINVKEEVFRKFADAATMERVRSTHHSAHQVGVKHMAKSNACAQVLKVFSRILHQS